MWLNLWLLGISLSVLFDNSLSAPTNQLAQTQSGVDGWSQAKANSYGYGYNSNANDQDLGGALGYNDMSQDYELWVRKQRQANFDAADDFLETEEDQVLIMQEHSSNNLRSKRAPCKKKNKTPQDNNDDDDDARRRKRQIEYEYDMMPETEGFGSEIEIQEGDMILVQENRPQFTRGGPPKFQHHPNHETPLPHEPLPHERYERSPEDNGDQDSSSSTSKSDGDSGKSQQGEPPFGNSGRQGRRGPPSQHSGGPPFHRGPPPPPPNLSQQDQSGNRNKNQGDGNDKESNNERKRRQATSLDSLLSQGFDANNLPANFASNLPADFDIFNIGDNIDPNQFTQGNAPTTGSDPNIIERFMEGIRKIINFFRNLDPQKRMQNAQNQQVAQ